MKPREGLTLGNRYRLIRRIAIGGMGEVWVANDHALGREVAVKVLREEYAGNEDFLNRLRTEARNSAALSHRNIAQMYDYGEQHSSGYLVMELVVGEPMADLLEREPVLPPSRLLPILSQTARALHAAHVAGVVHRDVKPGNILLERSGDVKITDFGVSLAANQVPMTAAGMVMGTAQYLSPEQAIGQAATGASDVYALGIVAYESVAGNRPFTGSTPVDIAVAHVNEPVPPLPATVHPDLAALILAMLAKDPVERPSTAATLARTFDELAVRIAEDPWGATARTGGAGATAPRRSRRARAAAEPTPHDDAPHGVSTDITPEITPLVIPDEVRQDESPRAGAGPDDAPAAGDAVAALPWERPAPAAGPSSRSGAADRSSSSSGTGRSDESTDGKYPLRRDMHGAARNRRTAAPAASRSRSGGAQRPPAIRPQDRRRPASDTRSHTPRTDRAAEPRARSTTRSAEAGGAAAGSTRAERRRASQQAAPPPTRTSTTTGLRIGGLPKGISWPLLALLGLLVVLLLATIIGRPSEPDPDALAPVSGAVTGAVVTVPVDTARQTGQIVTTSLRGDHDISAPDGMILEAAAPMGAPAVPTTLKDA